MDIPLLIEQHYDEWFESVWLVAVSKEIPAQAPDGTQTTYQNCRPQERIASQMPLDEKRAHAESGSRQ